MSNEYVATLARPHGATTSYSLICLLPLYPMPCQSADFDQRSVSAGRCCLACVVDTRLFDTTMMSQRGLFAAECSNILVLRPIIGAKVPEDLG